MCSYEIRGRNFLRMCSCKSLDLKSFGFCTYEKRVGGRGGRLLSLPSRGQNFATFCGDPGDTMKNQTSAAFLLWPQRTRLPQVPLREGATRTTFQILLESLSLRPFGERYVGNQAPWYEFLCMSGLARVVVCEAPAQIVCQPYVRFVWGDSRFSVDKRSTLCPRSPKVEEC